MEIRILDENDEYWQPTIELSEHCSWSAGKFLSKRMQKNSFHGFERVFAAIADNRVAGFCTLTETDYIPGNKYSPWIGFVFVEESFRGNRISERMIEKVLKYAKALGIEKVFISTDHDNLYEKYGFVQIDTLKSHAGTMEKILVRET